MILSLYNYGSNLREEFLLLKLFRAALEEEVRHKVDSLSDVSTGNPLVIKLIIQLSRQGHRVGQLRDLLGIFFYSSFTCLLVAASNLLFEQVQSWNEFLRRIRSLI